MIAVDERRSDIRTEVALVAGLTAGAEQASVVVVDLSASGARIRVDVQPDLDCEYLLHFTIQGTRYRARFRVIHWREDSGSYHWGGAFVGLSSGEINALRQAVHAAAGLSGLSIRDWNLVFEDARRTPADQVLVGATPAGRQVSLSGADCLGMGQDGVALFVRTVSTLEQG
ncbi:MAG: PilZ domain-containing protein [Chloroflexi bacterium]|nr:PilZ domain-containing protein [Chloroflexota bacterium]